MKRYDVFFCLLCKMCATESELGCVFMQRAFAKGISDNIKINFG